MLWRFKINLMQFSIYLWNLWKLRNYYKLVFCYCHAHHVICLPACDIISITIYNCDSLNLIKYLSTCCCVVHCALAVTWQKNKTKHPRVGETSLHWTQHIYISNKHLELNYYNPFINCKVRQTDRQELQLLIL